MQPCSLVNVIVTTPFFSFSVSDLWQHRKKRLLFSYVLLQWKKGDRVDEMNWDKTYVCIYVFIIIII